MLLVAFDKFSKWVKKAAVRKAAMEIVIKVLREQILTRYGAPKKLISDNGVQFTSNKFKTQLQKWGIVNQLTELYIPQENPAERANRTIKTMIAHFSGTNTRGGTTGYPRYQW